MPESPESYGVRPLSRLGRAAELLVGACGAAIVLGVAGCSMYHTLDARRHTWRGLDETDGHYGQPYYLPKAMVHLVVKADSGGGGKASEAATPTPTPNPSPTSNYSVIVNVNGKKVASVTPNPADAGKVDPVLGRGAAGAAQDATDSSKPKNQAPAGGATAPVAGGSPALPGAGSPALPPETAAGSGDKPKFDSAPVKYTITIETTIVPDMTTGPYYASYSPNWFYEEDAKLGINEKGLLASADADSSDKTAQVIYNLADTAINIAKFAGAGGGGFASKRVTQEEEKKSGEHGRVVTYKKLDIDVRFDPLDPKQVNEVLSFFQDLETTDSVYVSPFTVKVVTPASTGNAIPGKYPLNEKGLYFREPMPLEVHVVGREEVFREKVKNEMNNSLGAPHATLLAQLKAVNEQSGHHSERLTFPIPNKDRVFAFNIARSAFVTDKKVNLTMSDGQLTTAHIAKPSEALGFSEIPLNLSKRLADLPSGILTYRQDITTKQGSLTAAKTTSFNNDATLQDTIANRNLARQKAALDAQAARDKAQKAADDAAAALPNQ